MVKEKNLSLTGKKKRTGILKHSIISVFQVVKVVFAGNDYIITPTDFFQVSHIDNITDTSKYLRVQPC